jgi:hypothetical protein
MNVAQRVFPGRERAWLGHQKDGLPIRCWFAQGIIRSKAIDARRDSLRAAPLCGAWRCVVLLPVSDNVADARSDGSGQRQQSDNHDRRLGWVRRYV